MIYWTQLHSFVYGCVYDTATKHLQQIICLTVLNFLFASPFTNTIDQPLLVKWKITFAYKHDHIPVSRINHY